MKIILLFLFFGLHLSVFSQFSFSKGFDTLGKYTYPLLGAIDRPFASNIENGSLLITGNASGFFVRAKSRLFLVSAFHVFTDCEVYKGMTMNLRNQYVIVFYKDTLNNFKSQVLSLKDYKNKPCKFFYQYPDVDTMDVSGYFKDAKINSVESFFEGNFKKIKSIDSSKFICYGYPNQQYFEFIYKTKSADKDPFSYFEDKAEIRENKEFSTVNADSMYIAIKPALFAGTSGSPIFKLLINKKKKTQFFEFAGIQFGSNLQINQSYVVKAGELIKIISQLK